LGIYVGCFNWVSGDKGWPYLYVVTMENQGKG
jgi:hypothetical protein